MALKTLFWLLIISFLVATAFHDVAAAMGGRKEGRVGRWEPIKDPKDPKVQEIGEFAVSEHNKEAKASLKYESVVKGETKVVSGTNYRLRIEAEDGGVSGNYEAVVWDKPWKKFRQLTSFKRA
ncbi:hypothetical protein RJ639_030886 [Escallonia herrerae]|uniref:Cystatin domain-containing protein n=1 Tax=Escallonia herrerae TaxID=1293975 RepID=A0AA88WZ13_9ASTE|nr:hypothetical protein RJ639_030886 [Escallonia herrerae]